MLYAVYLSNYRKTHTAFRGNGLLTNGNDYFLFVDFYKEEGIDERYFKWQSHNDTKQDSDRGKNITFNKDRGLNLHLFVGKYRDIDCKS